MVRRMPDEDADARDQLVELGCKVLLFLFGFATVGLGFMFLVTPKKPSLDLWFGPFALEIGAFVGVFYWYLWHTKGGLRLLARIPPYRGGQTKAR
jgi:hypothetical protein